MDLIGSSSRMTCEDARASEDARAGVIGMLLCARDVRVVCSGRGNFHGLWVKDSVLGWYMLEVVGSSGTSCSCGDPASYRGYLAVVRIEIYVSV